MRNWYPESILIINNFGNHKTNIHPDIHATSVTTIAATGTSWSNTTF